MDTSNSTPLQKCIKCSNEYPLTSEYWHRNKGCTSGFVRSCKSCRNAYNVAYQAIYKPLHREELSAAQSVRYRERLEDYQEYYRGYYKQNLVKKAQQGKVWRAENPDKQRAITQRRKDKKRNLPNSWSVDDRSRMLEYWNHSCAVCGQPADLWHILADDHWIPVASPDCLGTVPMNMIPLCHTVNGGRGLGSCNISKGSKDPVIWLTERYGKRKAAVIANRIQAYFDSLQNQDTITE